MDARRGHNTKAEINDMQTAVDSFYNAKVYLMHSHPKHRGIRLMLATAKDLNLRHEHDTESKSTTIHVFKQVTASKNFLNAESGSWTKANSFHVPTYRVK